MNIFFQVRNLVLDENEKMFMARRIEGLHKFFSKDAHVYIDAERTRPDLHGDDLYRVSLRIQDGHYQYFTEDYLENVRKSFDHAYGEMFRMVRNDRSRSRTLARRARNKIKKIFKRSPSEL